jgi:hypothetical protein
MGVLYNMLCRDRQPFAADIATLRGARGEMGGLRTAADGRSGWVEGSLEGQIRHVKMCGCLLRGQPFWPRVYAWVVATLVAEHPWEGKGSCGSFAGIVVPAVLRWAGHDLIHVIDTTEDGHSPRVPQIASLATEPPLSNLF